VTIALYGAFKAGAPISVASPLIRLAGLLVASVVGVLFWKEGISLRYVIGMALSVAGIFLIVKS
jgi:drug/metabolite transporter (DMT)-like permease